MAIKFSCPGCGKRFSAADQAAGRRTKCVACGGGVEVPSPAAGDAGMSRVDPPPIPTLQVASAPARPVGRFAGLLASMSPLLKASLAANVLLAAIVVYQSRHRFPEYVGPTGDYRDVLLAMKLWPHRDGRFGMSPDKKYDDVQRKSREFYSEVIRSMPPGEDGMGMLVDASDLFKEDVLDMWIQCRSCSQMLAHDGIQITPIDALKAIDRYVGGCWSILFQDFNHKQKEARFEFFAPYQQFRRNGLSHDDAVGRVIELKWEEHQRAPR